LQLLGTKLKCRAPSYDNEEAHRLSVLFHSSHKQKVLLLVLILYHTGNFNPPLEFKKKKGKGLPQPAEVARGVPGWLRPRIFLTFGTTRVVGRQLYAPTAFTPRRNSWYSFLEAESTPGYRVPLVTMVKIPSETTGNRSRGRPTSSAVP